MAEADEVSELMSDDCADEDRAAVRHGVHEVGEIEVDCAANDLRVPVVGLDATEAGRPLYESEGFRPVVRTSRWKREAPRVDGALLVGVDEAWLGGERRRGCGSRLVGRRLVLEAR